MSANLKRTISLCLVLVLAASLLPVFAPTEALALDDDSAILMIAAGDEHTLALLDDHSVWAWGRNQYGQVGDSSTMTRNMPKKIMDPEKYGRVMSIAAGANHSIAVLEDGTVMAWGWNKNGQLGDSTTANRTEPVQVVLPGGAPFRVDPWGEGEEPNISAGFAHTVAIGEDGMLYGWGLNDYGQLGQGDNRNRINPSMVAYIYEPIEDSADAYGVYKYEAVEYGGADYVSAGYSYTLAVIDGDLYSFGCNTSGQLGQGDLINRNKPMMVFDGPDGSPLSPSGLRCGAMHALVLVGSDLYGWGSNNFGQLDTNAKSPLQFTKPILINDNTYDAQAGYHHTAIHLFDGDTVLIQGYNSRGQHGNGNVEKTKSTNLLKIPDPDYEFDYEFDAEEDYILEDEDFFPVVPEVELSAEYIFTGYYFAGAVDFDGNLWMWGENGYGQLGDGTYLRRAKPQMLPKKVFFEEIEPINSVKSDKASVRVGLGYKYGVPITVTIDPPSAMYSDIDWKIANTDLVSMIPLGPGDDPDKLTNSIYVFGNNKTGKVGSTTITGTAYNGKSVTISVTVRPNPETIMPLAAPSKLVPIGTTYKLRAEVRPAISYDATIIWSLHDWYEAGDPEPDIDDEGETDNGIAAIDPETGVLTSMDIGKFYVRAQSQQNPSAYKMIPVECGVFATSTKIYAEPYQYDDEQIVLKNINLYMDYETATPSGLPAYVSDRRKIYAANMPYDEAGMDVIWKSNNSVCEVIVDDTCDPGEAILVAKGIGTAIITATAADKSGSSAKLTVNVLQLGGVAEIIKPDRIMDESGDSIVLVKAGIRVNFRGKVSPNKSIQKLEWFVEQHASNTGIAGNIAQQTGAFTALSEGTCYVYGKTIDRPSDYPSDSPIDFERDIFTEKVRVEVIQPVEKLVILGDKKITVTKDKYSDIPLNYDDDLRFEVMTIPSSATIPEVKWSSSNMNVAMVDEESGDITLVGPGTAKITATSTDGTKKKAYGTIKVLSAPEYIVIDRVKIDKPPLAAGKSVTLRAKVYPLSASQEVTWIVEDYDSESGGVPVELDPVKGKVKAIGEGTVTIRAVSAVDENVTSDIDLHRKSNGDSVITCVVKVNRFKVVPNKLTMVSGTSAQIQVQIEPLEATNKGITMQSGNSEITADTDLDGYLEVDDDGFVTLEAGDVRGTYTVKFLCDGKTSSLKLTVLDPPEEIQILNDFDAVDNTIWKGKTIALKHKVLPGITDQSVIWYTSNESVATIDAKGNLKVVGGGPVEIWCVTKLVDEDGEHYAESDRIELISEVPVTAVKFVPNKAITLVEGGEPFELGVSILPADALNAEEWEFEAREEYISIEQNEESLIITPEEAGTETIKVTHLLSGKSASISVTVKGNPDEVVINRGVERSSPLKKGTALKLTAQVFPTSADQKVYWESNDTSLVKISANGSVTVVGQSEDEPGSVYAWTYNADGEVIRSDDYIIETLVPATGIKVTGGGKSVTLNDKTPEVTRICETSPVINAFRGTNDEWSVTSSNSNVADASFEENDDGSITLTITDGGTNGTCNITVRVAGKSAIIKVTVKMTDD